MKKNVSYFKWYLICVFTLALILCSTTAFGAIIHVPKDQPTIQASIDAASNGDTVLVADGTYTGVGNKDLDFKGKAITVQSENGPDKCIIDCEDAVNSKGFYFHNGEREDSAVSGFAITNASLHGIGCSGSSPTITNCIISGNGGVFVQAGGGVHCYESSPTITNCIISGNTVLFNGGGVYCYDSSPNITNCIISGNTVYYANGGGISCIFYSSPTIINCTISGNEAGSEGGGIHCCDSSPNITNCIFWGDLPDEIYIESGTPTVTYCDIQGGYSGEGNIDADPLFVGSGDYHLTEESPCIDAGTSEGAPDTDIDGNSRPQGAAYDIGSDEYGVTTVLLVRHADRANDSLSLDGWIRAKKLAHVARKAGVTAIYATQCKRTQQTVQPLADFLQLTPLKYCYGDYSCEEALVGEILSVHNGDVVLVAGHSNTVLKIAKLLGADISIQNIPDFDNLFVVTHKPGETNVINLQYGELSTSDIEANSCEMTTLLLVRHDAEQDDTGQRAEKLAHVAFC